MGKRVSGLTALFSALLLTLLLGSATAQDIDLPFDYFYGRWVDGHQPGFDFYLKENVRPAREASYGVVTGSCAFGANHLVGEVVSFDSHGILYFPTLFLQVRPKPNWQVGVDSLNYWAYDRTRTSDYHLQTGWRSSFAAAISSHWMNSKSPVISDRHGPYSYLVRSLPRKGTVQLDNSVQVSMESGHYTYTLADRNQYSYDRSSHDSFRLSISNELRWSCQEWLWMDARMNLVTSNEANDRPLRYGIGLGSELHLTREERRREFELDYAIDARIATSGALYATVGVAQGFEEEDKHLWDLIDQYSSDGRLSHEQSELKFGEVSSSCHLDLHYITRGEFDSRVIKDDYDFRPLSTVKPDANFGGRSFYGRMLHRRQMLLSVSFQHTSVGKSDYGRNRRNLALNMAVRYGFSNKIELLASAHYSHSKIPRGHADLFHYYADLKTEIGVKVRSFAYEPSVGPGWDRDSRLDVAYSPIMPTGHWQASLVFVPAMQFRWYTSERFPFGSWSDFRRDHGSQLLLKARLGLGRDVEIRAYDTLSYSSSAVYRYAFGWTIVARVGELLQLSTEYSQVVSKQDYFWFPSLPSGEWIRYNPEISLSLRALL